MHHRTDTDAPDRGAITLWWVTLIAGVLILTGMVVDLGSKLRAVEAADAMCAEAARAGAQAVDPTKAIPGQGVVLDPGRAAAAAQDYLQHAHVRGTARAGTDGHSIQVDATVTHKTLFLQVIGITSLTAEGHASAELLHGVTAPEG